MITAFYLIIAFLLFVFLSFLYMKRIISQFMNEELRIITSLKNKEKLVNIPDNIKAEYEETFNKIITQERDLINSIEELKEYRTELDITYNTLVMKSSQLEYTNQILELRVKNLSDLNQISRSISSLFNLDKIINTITDAYFILTPTKRMSVYLWENGKLINKKIKGAIDYSEDVSYPLEAFEKFTQDDFNKIYYDLARQITVLNGEKITISPLKVKDKEIGVLFTIQDMEKLIDLNKEMISALAIQASIAIDNANSHLELLVKERISQELDLAANIQKQILPAYIEGVKGIEVAAHFSPAKEIGGDYYDYSIKNNIFSINIADVSGKGIPAAFLMALSRSMLKTINCVSNYSPAEELNLFNKIIYKDITEDMFITIMNSKYDMNTGTLVYSSAGHNPLVVYRKNTNEIELCGTKGVAVGFMQEYSYKEKAITLFEGDIVVFYTDGIIEAEDENKKMFGIEKLQDVIFKNSNLSAEELKEKILFEILEFRKDYEQIDDITFVILKCKNLKKEDYE